MSTIDLIIVGAGPAGISTALHLLQEDRGWAGRMLVLEKAAHPRPKLCGGGVTRLGLNVLHGLGFPLPLPLPQARVDDVRLKYGNHILHARGLPQFVVFHRPELDAYLAAQARQRGAVICENEAVTSFSLDGDGVTLSTERSTYRARAVVAADGSRGIFRRAMKCDGASPPAKHRHVARLLETLDPVDGGSSCFTQRAALFDFTPLREGLQGYCWEFPSWVGGQPIYNRGIYDARVDGSRERARLPELLRGFIASNGAGGESPVDGHPLHWFSPRQRLAWPHLLLVGDAAGADPLFGEGIAPALGYGQVAAQAIRHAFARGDFSFADYRERVLAAPVGRYLMFRWVSAEGSYRLSRSRLFMRLFWILGDIVARLWPELPEFYPTTPIPPIRGGRVDRG